MPCGGMLELTQAYMMQVGPRIASTWGRILGCATTSAIASSRRTPLNDIQSSWRRSGVGMREVFADQSIQDTA